MNDWNPKLYMTFGSERTQPSIDLMAKLNIEPESVIDIGCGPGNSTQVLAKRWPNADITGLDSSPAMIRQASQEYPGQEWIVSDALTFSPDRTYDLVFSNAVIQWIPDQESLLKKFHDILSDTGVLAVQVPLFFDMPLSAAITDTAAALRWEEKTRPASDLLTIHDYSFYYDQLSAMFRSVELWETHYMNIMDSHEAIIEMMRSTGLKPYLECLKDPTESLAFEQEVLHKIRQVYPTQQDGTVILPFKRLFFVGSK